METTIELAPCIVCGEPGIDGRPCLNPDCCLHRPMNPHEALTHLIEQQLREVYEHSRTRGINRYTACTIAYDDIRRYVDRAVSTAYTQFTHAVGSEAN